MKNLPTRKSWFIVLCLAWMASASSAVADPSQPSPNGSFYTQDKPWRLSLLYGKTAEDLNDLNSTHDQTLWGGDVDYRLHDSLWSVVFSAHLSEAEDTFGLIDINASSDDYMLGMRYNTPSPVGHLYAGGGWVYADATVNAKGPGIPAALRGTHSGSGSGYWLGAGVVWDLGHSMTLGFDATMTDGIGDIDMGNGIMADVESTTLAVTLGIRF